MNNKSQKLEAFARILDVLDMLRTFCPWDRKQTNQTLRDNTIEEVYELSDAILADSTDEMRKELGDVLLHVLFYAKIGEEQKSFDIADVCNALCNKLIFRHPHVYAEAKVDSAEEVSSQWEKVKQIEKGGNESLLAGVPSSLPSIIKAFRITEKAAAVGFDWPEKEQVWKKVEEEQAELKAAIRTNDTDNMEEEFGDLFFALVNAARLHGINPDNALERSNRKFISRLGYIEEMAQKMKCKLDEMSLAEMDKLWEEAKVKEKTA